MKRRVNTLWPQRRQQLHTKYSLISTKHELVPAKYFTVATRTGFQSHYDLIVFLKSTFNEACR